MDNLSDRSLLPCKKFDTRVFNRRNIDRVCVCIRLYVSYLAMKLLKELFVGLCDIMCCIRTLVAEHLETLKYLIFQLFEFQVYEDGMKYMDCSWIHICLCLDFMKTKFLRLSSNFMIFSLIFFNFRTWLQCKEFASCNYDWFYLL